MDNSTPIEKEIKTDDENVTRIEFENNLPVKPFDNELSFWFKNW
jgi:hypothetical protein